LLRFALVLATLGVAGCGREPRPPAPGAGGGALGPGVLARVGTAELTEDDLNRMLPPEVREGVSGSEVRDIVDRWVRSELLYQKALHDGLSEEPEIVARLRSLERELLADEQLERELTRRVRVTGEELQAYYRAHLAEYTQEVQLKQIVVNTREEADDAMRMLRSGAIFEQLARTRSIDESANAGGDLGFLGKDAMNPEFEPIVFKMQPGEIAGPVLSTFGFHVVKMVARRNSMDPISFDAARDEIMRTLLLEKQQVAQAKLIDELRAAAAVQIATTYAGLSLEPEPATPEPPVQTLRSGGEELPPASDSTSRR
jgi:hypothetical protein